MTRAVGPELVQEEAWRDHAACLSSDPSLFFADGRGGHSSVEAAKARRVCARCPVRAACLEYAITNRERYGIWGGMDRDERRAYAKAQRRRTA